MRTHYNLSEIKDRRLIEAVQRRATKLIPQLRELPYEDRLKSLELPSMYYRRERGDMIEVYKYTHGLYDSDTPFKLAVSDTRGHSLKIFKSRANKSLRQHFFSHRVVDKWNSLPESKVQAPTLNNFKNQLDQHWKQYLYAQKPISLNNFNKSEKCETPRCEQIVLEA